MAVSLNVEQFFLSNWPGYPHPVRSEREEMVSEWRPVIAVSLHVGGGSALSNGKTLHVNAKHYRHNKDGHTAPGFYGHGSVPLNHSGNVVREMNYNNILDRDCCRGTIMVK